LTIKLPIADCSFFFFFWFCPSNSDFSPAPPRLLALFLRSAEAFDFPMSSSLSVSRTFFRTLPFFPPTVHLLRQCRHCFLSFRSGGYLPSQAANLCFHNRSSSVPFFLLDASALLTWTFFFARYPFFFVRYKIPLGSVLPSLNYHPFASFSFSEKTYTARRRFFSFPPPSSSSDFFSKRNATPSFPFPPKLDRLFSRTDPTLPPSGNIRTAVHLFLTALPFFSRDRLLLSF